MYLSQKTQIAYLKINEVFTEVLSKYNDFANIFLPKLTIELPKYTNINNHAIKLVDN